MYGYKGGTSLAMTGGTGAVLAKTGLPVIGLTIVAISLLMLGFILTRAALVRRKPTNVWD